MWLFNALLPVQMAVRAAKTANLRRRGQLIRKVQAFKGNRVKGSNEVILIMQGVSKPLGED